ncbi:flagellar assembly protein FliH [Litoricolaceae bacterium]|nr:flagellar assembly protein FliH [Litorivicinaceae bacterium]
MASSKTAYVAFGGDASISFASDEVLNRPSSRAFDDPPWKVFDSDVQFEPMFVEGYAPAAEADVSALESTDTEHAEDSGHEVPDDSGMTSDTLDSDGPEWAEVADHIPEIMGVPEDEVLARIEEAVAAAKAELMTAHAQQVAELEGTITALKESHQAECMEIKEKTAADLEVQVKATITQYQELIQQIQNASNRVSEFFEPLAKLSVHIAEQLVRGELTIGPVAITRLVQGCLDSIEDRLSTNEPVLKMHPADLEMFLTGFDEKPSGVRFVADDGLARGDVSLQMDHSVIDDLLAHRMEQITQYVFGRSEDRDDVLFDADVTNVSALDAEVKDVIDGELSDTQPDALDADPELTDDQETLEASDVAIEVDSSITDVEATPELAVEAVEDPDQDGALALEAEAEAEAEADAASEPSSDTTETDADESPPVDPGQKSDS